MNIRIFLSAIFGTIILFAWNVFSWTALPLHTGTVNNLPVLAFDTATLRLIMPEDGVYQYPGAPGENTTASWMLYEKQIQRGPSIPLMVYKAGGSELISRKILITDAIIDLLTVILLLVVLTKLQDKTMSSIWSTCVIIGAIVGLIGDFAQMNWYYFPLDYTVAKVFDHLVAFTLLGLFFGGFTFNLKENYA